MNATRTVQTRKIFKRSLETHEAQLLSRALHTSRLVWIISSYFRELFALLCEKPVIYHIFNGDQNKAYDHGYASYTEYQVPSGYFQNFASNKIL